MKTLDFLSNAFGTAALAWFIGYGWFLLAGINTVNALIMLAGMAAFSIASLTALVALVVWTLRHVRVRITIV